MPLAVLGLSPAALFLNPLAIIDHYKRFWRIIGHKDFGVALGSFAKPKERSVIHVSHCLNSNQSVPQATIDLLTLFSLRSMRFFMEQEIWRPIEGLDGIAEVSNQGRVRTLDRTFTTDAGIIKRVRGRIISQHVTRYGYAEVQIRENRVLHRHRVHRLVATAFVPGAFDGAHVDHLDCNKLNNRAENLEWVTNGENTRRQHKAGILAKPRDNNPTAKLSDLQAHAVRILYHHNFPPRLLGEWFGVSESLTYQIGKDGKPPKPLRSRKSPTVSATRRQTALF